MNGADIPGFPQAEAALREADYADGRMTAAELAVCVLKAATPAILAAALADIADGMSEETEWEDGQVLAVFLDAMSARIRERTGL